MTTGTGGTYTSSGINAQCNIWAAYGAAIPFMWFSSMGSSYKNYLYSISQFSHTSVAVYGDAGGIIANHLSDFFCTNPSCPSPNFVNPIETKVLAPCNTNGYIWLGFDNLGVGQSGANCVDWTSSSSSDTGWFGTTGAVNNYDYGFSPYVNCAAGVAGIYCLNTCYKSNVAGGCITVY